MKMFLFMLLLVPFSLAGCSMPASAVQGNLPGFTREEKAKKSKFAGKKKIVTIRDFRGKEATDADIDKLKNAAREYIALHPGLSEEAKNNLLELKVIKGSTAEQAAFILGNPDKKSRLRKGALYGADERWIYRAGKLRAFTVFIFPVFFLHEAYYLYFKDNMLVEIERRFLKQTIRQGEGPGVVENKK